MQHTTLLTAHANGTRAKYHITPPIRHPNKLFISGLMTNGGVDANTILINVSGVQASGEALVLSTTAANTRSANAVAAVADSGKWRHKTIPHAIGQFQSNELHYLEIEIIDSSTGVAAAWAAPGGTTNIVVLEFTITHNDKRFVLEPGVLPTYKADMYNALN